VGEGGPENRCNFLNEIYYLKKMQTTLTIKITWIE
jgi:hypothetical protein